MDFVASNGGPLVAVPAERAVEWRGTDPPSGIAVPKGWEWSGDDADPIRTDYDLACGKLRAYHESSYGGLGLSNAAGGDVLVFKAPTDTTFLPLPDGGVFLRNVRFTTVAAAKKAVASAPRWKKTRIEIALEDGRLFVFDAAYAYPNAKTPKRARPAILTAKLGPGRYRVHACDWMPVGSNDHELRAYRFERS